MQSHFIFSLQLTATTGEPKFPECQTLPRVPKIGHSGKPIFPECCTRGTEAFPSAAKPMALGEGWHSGKAFFPECNTRGRGTITKGISHLTVPLDGTVYQKNEKYLPRVPCSSTRGRWPLPRVPCANTRGRSLFPECLFLALGEGSLPLVSRGSTRGNIFIFLVLLLHFLVMPCHII
jgi:hypothetical protein